MNGIKKMKKICKHCDNTIKNPSSRYQEYCKNCHESLKGGNDTMVNTPKKDVKKINNVKIDKEVADKIAMECIKFLTNDKEVATHNLKRVISRMYHKVHNNEI